MRGWWLMSVFAGMLFFGLFGAQEAQACSGAFSSSRCVPVAQEGLSCGRGLVRASIAGFWSRREVRVERRRAWVGGLPVIRRIVR